MLHAVCLGLTIQAKKMLPLKLIRTKFIVEFFVACVWKIRPESAYYCQIWFADMNWLVTSLMRIIIHQEFKRSQVKNFNLSLGHIRPLLFVNDPHATRICNSRGCFFILIANGLFVMHRNLIHTRQKPDPK